MMVLVNTLKQIRNLNTLVCGISIFILCMCEGVRNISPEIYHKHIDTCTLVVWLWLCACLTSRCLCLRNFSPYSLLTLSLSFNPFFISLSFCLYPLLVFEIFQCVRVCFCVNNILFNTKNDRRTLGFL